MREKSEGMGRALVRWAAMARWSASVELTEAGRPGLAAQYWFFSGTSTRGRVATTPARRYGVWRSRRSKSPPTPGPTASTAGSTTKAAGGQFEKSFNNGPISVIGIPSEAWKYVGWLFIQQQILFEDRPLREAFRGSSNLRHLADPDQRDRRARLRPPRPIHSDRPHPPLLRPAGGSGEGTGETRARTVVAARGASRGLSHSVGFGS